MFSTVRRVEFRDTDAAGIMHFSAFFPMMESAEHEMLRSIGLSVMPRKRRDAPAGSSAADPDGLDVTWPRVSANCDYSAAVRFEDQLKIDVHVAKIGTSSVTYQFDFTCEGRSVACGKITVVCCRLTPQGLSKVTIPESIRQRLGEIADC